MEIIDEIIIKRKVYISTIGWISAITASLVIYFSVFKIIEMMVFYSNPIFEEFKNENFQETLSLFKGQKIMLTLNFSFIIFSGFFLYSSIGLLKNKHWGRKTFIIISWVLISLSIILIALYCINSGIVLNNLIGNHEEKGYELKSMTTQIRKVLSIQVMSYGILLVVLIRSLFKIVLRFKSDDYKIFFS